MLPSNLKLICSELINTITESFSFQHSRPILMRSTLNNYEKYFSLRVLSSQIYYKKTTTVY